ncbi:DUF2264 domain-containing protein [Streptomyces sp. NPDC059740]|uniref:DUF2264 domain-containing protein n=1 Tax=Streptomyces sp. NPDC059740 TaxID=3346926 RepID=UPI003669B583
MTPRTLRTPFPLPPADRTLSPHTGFTRDHVEALADGLLAAAWRWASPGGARLDLPGPPSKSGVRSDGLEGYARTFLAAAFRTAGAGGKDPHGLLTRYADGLAAGTATPGRPDADSWPRMRDYTVFGQPTVESASIALSLNLTRPWLWDRLEQDVQDRAAAWLRDALTVACPPNNWLLFPLTVAAFLESAGRGDETTRRVIQRGLDACDHWYQGQGWYRDGDLAAYDHYNGWALHLYPVLHGHLTGDPAVADRYGDRLTEHLRTFALTFDADGAPLHLGRSLTYRFAAAAGVGLGAVTGHTPLTPGTSRRLITGAMRYFLERGALSEDGLLTLGWHGPHPATLQNYSGPGSPYWASKAFVCLLAGPDHPLWTATEERAPVQERDRLVAVRAPGWLIHTTARDGLVRVHQHGDDHVPEHAPATHEGVDVHYARLAYSTRTGPTAPANAPDNHVAVVLADGTRSARRRVRELGCGADEAEGWGWAASAHTPVFPEGTPVPAGLEVQSVTVARGRWELRVHRVRRGPEDSAVHLTGWAVGPEDGLTSVLHPLTGLVEEQAIRAPQGTAFTRWAVLPHLSGPAAGDRVVAALACLSTEPADPADVVEVLPSQGAVLRVRWRADDAVTTVAFAPELSVTTG